MDATTSWESAICLMPRICPQCGRPGINPWVGKIPWRRAWLSTQVFLPGESPWTEEPSRLQSVGLQRVGHDCELNTHTHTHTRACAREDYISDCL